MAQNMQAIELAVRAEYMNTICSRPSNKRMRILNKLNGIASTSEMNYQHAAGVLKHGKLIAYSVNSHRSKYTLNHTPFIRCSLHAELAVLKRLLYDLSKNDKLSKRKMKKYELVVVRKNYTNSRPCKHCMRVVRRVGIRKVCYTNGDLNMPVTNLKTRDMDSDHQSRAVAISTNYLKN